MYVYQSWLRTKSEQMNSCPFQAEKDYFLVEMEEADGSKKLVVLAKKRSS